jgi:hypothetical protein
VFAERRRRSIFERSFMLDPERNRVARAAAEAALVRVGTRPEFVLLGGLLPEYLCAASEFRHAGTTDVDVQVDLEIACGTVNGRRLEKALRNAEFQPESGRVWRWAAHDGDDTFMVVKFELLAHQDDVKSREILVFDECDALGAVNLRGTGFAARDATTRQLTARVGDLRRTVEINVAGLAGFLMAKAAAARERRKRKDWYDIAFVLLHNDAGGPEEAARVVLEQFGDELVGAPRTALDDLAANFAERQSQGPDSYAAQMLADHPDLDRTETATDSIVAVTAFHRILFGG